MSAIGNISVRISELRAVAAELACLDGAEVLREIKRTFRSYSQLPVDGSHMCALNLLWASPSPNPMTSVRSADQSICKFTVQPLDSSVGTLLSPIGCAHSVHCIGIAVNVTCCSG